MSRATEEASQIPAERLALLLRVSAALAKTLELQSVLQTAVDSACEVMGLETGAIYLLNGDNLYLGATVPVLPEDFPENLRHASLPEHPHLSTAIATQSPIYVADLETAELAHAEREAAKIRGLRSILYVPLIVEDRAVGIFMVGSIGHVQPIPKGDIVLCGTMATTIALAVANAQLFDSIQTSNADLRAAYDDLREHQAQLRALAIEMTMAEERQRRELAIELHDRISQPLAVLRMKFDDGLSRAPHHAEDREFLMAQTMLDEAIDQTRALTLETSPPYIFDLGLRPALDWLAEKTAAHGIECDVVTEGDVDSMAELSRLFAFQAARELLANVVKHACASTASVTVRRAGDGFVLRVTDDGRGFSTTGLSPRPAGDRGFGLFSLRERAHHVGGTLEIASSVGIGTTVTLDVPRAPSNGS